MFKTKDYLIFILAVTLANRIAINLFMPGFTTSLSVIVLGLFLYIYQKINPLIVIPASGLVAALFRGIIEYPLYGSVEGTLRTVAPDFIFMVIYALIYWTFSHIPGKHSILRFSFTIFICDFISDLLEIMIRIGIQGLEAPVVRTLLIVALSRTVLALILITIYQYQKTLITQEEHETRYRDLLLQTASFKTELYFMNKNLVEIEDVMKKSFEIYNRINEGRITENLKDMALDIAKDVHEIKKDYLRRIKGMEAFAEFGSGSGEMRMTDLTEIIRADSQSLIDKEGFDIDLSINVEMDIIIKEHYFLTTIIKNLLNNSIESIGKKKAGYIRCTIEHIKNKIIITVRDNGEGIRPDDLAVIFKPGYSSRFDDVTGDINRGLGLTLVKDLVENYFRGSITVDSKVDEGSRFTIKIQEESLTRWNQ